MLKHSEDDPYQGKVNALSEQTRDSESANQPDPIRNGRTDNNADVPVRKSMIVTLKTRRVVDQVRSGIDGSTQKYPSSRRSLRVSTDAGGRSFLPGSNPGRSKKRKSSVAERNNSTAEPASQPPKKSHQGKLRKRRLGPPQFPNLKGYSGPPAPNLAAIVARQEAQERHKRTRQGLNTIRPCQVHQMPTSVRNS